MLSHESSPGESGRLVRSEASEGWARSAWAAVSRRGSRPTTRGEAAGAQLRRGQRLWHVGSKPCLETLIPEVGATLTGPS
jgi:hypothetical protein